MNAGSRRFLFHASRSSKSQSTCCLSAMRELPRRSTDDARPRTFHGSELDRLRGLLQAGSAGDSGAASQRSERGVEKERPSIRSRRARERNLGPEPVVDHDDSVEEVPPKDDAVRAPGVREVDADKRPEALQPEPGHDDQSGVDGNGVVAGRGEDLDRVDDGKAKALGERGVDAVVARPGVDEGAT